MMSEVKKYFKHLELVREDLREEFDQLGIATQVQKVCDFGCGDGITTFGLALEIRKSDCIGLDLFGLDSVLSLEKLCQHIETVEQGCKNTPALELTFPGDLCKLVYENRIPRFQSGNIVRNQNLPTNLDLAYCKKLLINIRDRKYGGALSGEDGVLAALRNIAQSIHSQGRMCVIEYDPEFELEKYFTLSKLQIVERAQLQRKEIRLKGRTEVVSLFTLYLCQRFL